VRKARSAIYVTALLMAASALPAPAATPSGGTRYTGKTSEGLGVRLRVSASGGYVASMHIRYDVHCSDGAVGAPSTDLYDLRIDGHGRFNFAGKYTVRRDGSRNRVRMHGLFSRRRASGSFVLTGKRKKVHCRSKRVSWHARAVS
jgi:hypothetical protein